ncbi:TetR/AcrR family transcriptional regulator [Streptomyces marincola]|uniref:TetR/AcrR family transcriptional regulator n=1 Tax=Streptomyces marincola TaxID=2878388 RepID=UPI001CF2DF2C|nr:TetR/AcrR family transcriptional regulator [Streptomyces marincola]UCM90365.1 TetR/AcrR family transcriptional regulator [Streptomyces marincola]
MDSSPAPPGRPPAPRADRASGPAYRRLSTTERRGQLIAAAQRLFAHAAPEDVSLDDVAREAGVSRPLVYRYFPGGKQQVYETALRGAAADLELCFAVPARGPLSQRLADGLDRYLAFVDEHGEGFTALLKGGSVVETSRTTAIVDGVRRAAARQVLLHMGTGEPGPRLRMAVRTWITAVEAASLIWLDENREPPVGELRDLLVEQFIAQLVVTAGRDAQAAAVLRAAARSEPPGGRVDALVARGLAALSAAAAPEPPPPAAPAARTGAGS